MEMHSPEVKTRRGVGRRGAPGQRGPVSGKEEENRAWLAMLEKATSSVRYISRHIKKEHFIREVSGQPWDESLCLPVVLHSIVMRLAASGDSRDLRQYVLGFSACGSHFFQYSITAAPVGNFFEYFTNVYSDSRMN